MLSAGFVLWAFGRLPTPVKLAIAGVGLLGALHRGSRDEILRVGAEIAHASGHKLSEWATRYSAARGIFAQVEGELSRRLPLRAVRYGSLQRAATCALARERRPISEVELAGLVWKYGYERGTPDRRYLRRILRRLPGFEETARGIWSIASRASERDEST